jgi:hypothetical protein
MAITTLVALVALAACGSGDGHDAGSAGKSALPKTHTSAPSDPQTPTGIEQENPKRFVQRWAAAEARLRNTGKIAPYVALSRSCAPCRRLASTIAGYYAAGGYIHGGSWRIDSVKLDPAATSVVTYKIEAHVASATVRESSSGPVRRVPGGQVTYRVGLVAKGSSFVVSSRTRQP